MYWRSQADGSPNKDAPTAAEADLHCPCDLLTSAVSSLATAGLDLGGSTAKWNGRIDLILVLLAFAAASMGGINDPVGVLFVAAPMCSQSGAWTFGVVVVGDEVISRGWFRKRTSSRAQI